MILNWFSSIIYTELYFKIILLTECLKETCYICVSLYVHSRECIYKLHLVWTTRLYFSFTTFLPFGMHMFDLCIDSHLFFFLSFNSLGPNYFSKIWLRVLPWLVSGQWSLDYLWKKIIIRSVFFPVNHDPTYNVYK